VVGTSVGLRLGPLVNGAKLARLSAMRLLEAETELTSVTTRLVLKLEPRLEPRLELRWLARQSGHDWGRSWTATMSARPSAMRLSEAETELT